MDGYQLGKDIEAILQRLARLEALLANQGGQIILGHNDAVRPFGLRDRLTLSAMATTGSHSDGPTQFDPGSLNVSVGGASGLSRGSGGDTIPMKNNTDDNITIGIPGSLSIPIARQESVHIQPSGSGEIRFEVRYKTKFLRTVTGSIGEGEYWVYHEVTRPPQGKSADSMAHGPASPGLVVSGRGEITYESQSLWLG